MIAALKRQWREDWSEIVGSALALSILGGLGWYGLALFNPLGG
jgi:hypothetical protein